MDSPSARPRHPAGPAGAIATGGADLRQDERDQGTIAVIGLGYVGLPLAVADVGELERAVGYRPATPVKEGVAAFVEWYRDYYRAAADA